jgi:hypothetical protein
MVKPKKGALCVEAQGKRRYINVPAGRALDLHNYLRSKKVRSAPPEPAFTGFDSIELAHDIEIDSIQILLNTWS